MANRKIAAGMSALALMFGMAAAVWADLPTKPPALSAKMLELLVKYTAPEQQTWGKDAVSVYYVDPLRFEEFKAELDALGKYQAGSWNEVRDWEKGLTFARCAVRADGSFEISLCKADNSVSGYRYKKFPKAQKLKADALLRKYLVPTMQTWENPAGTVLYLIDPLRFDAFKAELDGIGEYSQVSANNEDNRDWDRGKSQAMWVVFPDGYELFLLKPDNSTPKYQYKKAGKPKG